MQPNLRRDQPCSTHARGLDIPQSLSRSLRRAPVLSPEEETATATAAWLAREEAWGLVLGDRHAAEAAVLAALDLARGDGGEVSKSTAAARRVLLDALSTGEAARIARADKDDLVLRVVVGRLPATLATRAQACIVRLDAAVGRLERHNITFVLHLIRHQFQGWLGGDRGYSAGAQYEVGDLLGFGMLGLHIAALRFDPTRGCKFTTFAEHWISHAIRREVQDSCNRVRIPVHAQARISAVVRASSALLAAGQAATTETIAAKTGLSVAQVEAALEARHASVGVSLHAKVRSRDGEGDDTTEVGDLMPDHSAPEDDLVHALDEGHRAEVLYSAMQDLEPVERYVVRRRAGLDGAAPAILTEVGEALGLSRQRVQQIEQGARKALRRSIEARMR